MALYTVNPGTVVSAADPNQFTNLLNGTTTNTQVTVSNRIRAQLTGAATGTGGYVGETPSLTAPTTGTFIAGDFASDANGLVWVCKAAGSPGTWSALPTQIATQTLGGTAASVTFSSVPAFNHISMIWKARGDSAATAVQFFGRLNGDTASHYVWQVNQANNATVAGTDGGGLVAQMQLGTMTAATSTANYFSSGQFTIAYWNDATNFATVQGTTCAFVTATNSFGGTYSGLYNQAVTLTSVTVFPASGNFVAGSRFSLYGWM